MQIIEQNLMALNVIQIQSYTRSIIHILVT